MSRILVIAILLGYILLPANNGVLIAEMTEVELARDGRPLVPVVVSERASDRVIDAATELADYLGRISGAKFDVRTGEGRDGIAVGVVTDFPALNLQDQMRIQEPEHREQYLLRSHGTGVYVIGATERGVAHAVWALLYELGHRQFFPGAVWEVIPSHADLAIAIDIHDAPDYLTRSIWYGYGMWGYNEQPLHDWRVRNRAASEFTLNTGHAYGQVVDRYKEEFETHPEYFCHVNGTPTHKLCAGRSGLRELVVQYALDYFQRHPNADTVSIDPSDGGGWGTDCPCVALGSPSNRALTLANEIGRALDDAGLDKYVAMYAYNEHSPPPTIEAHPRVIINVATGFIRGGYSVEQLLAGWGDQGVQQFGIREYYSVHPWDRDLPGKARAGNLDYLARTITQFYEAGARYLTAEAGDNWGPNGLGHYLAVRMMWDLDEADRLDELKADFYDKAFGAAKEPMAAFYELIDGANKPLVSDDLVGRMYRLIHQAMTLAGDDRAIRARLDHLTLYTHYVERYRAYSRASGKARQTAFEKLIRYAYRMRKTMMVHTKGLYRDLARRDDQVSMPKNAAYNVSEQDNPWKRSEPFTREELDTIISAGIDGHDLLTFQAVSFSDDLVPARFRNVPRSSATNPSWIGRGHRVYYTWVDKAPAKIRLRMTGGMIAHYRDRGDVDVRLYPTAEVEGLFVDQASIPPDGKSRTIVLSTDHVGLHRIVFTDGNDMTQIVADSSRPLTFEIGSDYTPRHRGQQSMYFYVPRGTKVVGGHISSKAGSLLDGQGRKVHQFDKSGFFHVNVPGGQDGRIWRVDRIRGQLKLMTVPPYASQDPDTLLLPREVVEADSL